MRCGIHLLLYASLGCTTAPRSADRPLASEPTTVTPIAEQDSRSEELELSVPLLGGGAVELARFAGKVVILELSASYVDGWNDAHARYRSLLDEHGEDHLSVITVSLDMRAQALTQWEQDPPPFVLGWDPQGALAVRLGVTRLPTVFVLSHDGHVLLEQAGASNEISERLERIVAAALATLPSP